MAKRIIVKEGDPILRTVARKVTEFDDKLGLLIDDMVQTMQDANGCGLAANQVSVLKRIFIADDGEGVREFVNPEIISSEGSQTSAEGCLSIPQISGEIERPERLKLKYQDRKGNKLTLEAKGHLAVIICHENDHLDGKLFTDYIKKE